MPVVLPHLASYIPARKANPFGLAICMARHTLRIRGGGTPLRIRNKKW